MGKKRKKYVTVQNSTGSGASGGTTYYGRRWSKCSHGVVHVCDLGKAKLFAGSRDDVLRSRIPWRLLIVCAGTYLGPKADVEASADARPLLSPELLSYAVPPWVALEWEDGRVPLFGSEVWEPLARDVAKIDGPVGVYCLGGHGRTGTALTILATLGGAVPAGADPVLWLRNRYCREIVETNEQVAYVERVTRRQSRAVGSWETDLGMPGGWYGPSRYAYSGVAQGKAPAPPPSPAAPTAGGRVGKPILNRAGDVIGYDYTAKGGGDEGADPDPDTGDGPASRPWTHC